MTRVLYVEDESLLALSMEAALESSGLDVQLAHDGEEGIERARHFAPEIIVTDYMMPRLDGMAMIRALRAEGVQVPIIVTTAIPEKDLDPEARQRFEVYIGKPFSEEELLAAIRQLAPEGG